MVTFSHVGMKMFSSAVDLNKCLKLELQISLDTCPPISGLPSNVSTRSPPLELRLRPSYRSSFMILSEIGNIGVAEPAQFIAAPAPGPFLEYYELRPSNRSSFMILSEIGNIGVAEPD